MRAFSRPTGIDRLSLEARIVYTLFSIFMLAGYGTSVWFYLDDDLGLRPQNARVYYLGEEKQSGPEDPALDIPEELDQPLRLQKAARQVMETFHFHLFSVSVCLLIIGHLFMMCSPRPAWKVTVIAVGGLSTLVHLLAPPLIRFATPSAAVLMFPSAALMGATWLYMTLQPLYEMWRPAPAAKGPSERPT